MARIIEGSASCERFQFFDAPPPARRIRLSPTHGPERRAIRVLLHDEGYAGEVAGVPAFIVETIKTARSS